ncbi:MULTISPECIES: hypothetical protein [unclassified Acinetobacter]|uniref:DUF7684 family protein n=1 Tax=unclassified Acinetobacter TaxID=196816 RepID=UPI00257568ED|nr:MULTISPECIES: hypothetical protein [unclassified Acinetobacter]MDM1763219.1 hypothetical protein [Acinetobacter sp. 226-1]MDM1766698.1 hypothetical protein [Acinetobacter sp. 226-4]
MNRKIKVVSYELLVNQLFKIELPNSPYLLLIAIHSPLVNTQWRYDFCNWVVKSKQCYWALAWGHECSMWDDALDLRYLEFCNYDLPEDNDYNLMTTWHENQTLYEVIEFAQSVAVNTLPQQDLYQIIVLNIH